MEEGAKATLIPGEGFRAVRELPRYSKHSVFVETHLNSPAFQRRNSTAALEADPFAKQRQSVVASVAERMSRAKAKSQAGLTAAAASSQEAKNSPEKKPPDPSFWMGASYELHYRIDEETPVRAPESPRPKAFGRSSAVNVTMYQADAGGYKQLDSLEVGGYTQVATEEEQPELGGYRSIDEPAPPAQHHYSVPERITGRSRTDTLEMINSYLSHPNSPAFARRKKKNRAAISTQLLDRYHDALELLSRSPKPSTDVQQKCHEEISTLAANFEREATLYGRVIISEVSLSEEEKTILPLKSSGILGGDKFLVGGIYMKFATDQIGIFGRNEDAAHKVSGHEIKSLVKLMEANVPGLRLPLMCLVDFLGCRLVAMSALPIDGKSSLCYGSMDGGQTFACDEEVLPLMNQLGAFWNLAAHQVNGHEHIIRTPTDLEVHRGSDGHYYALDFSRLFPPDVAKRNVPGGIFYQLLRPELVQHFERALSSDAWSSFQTTTESQAAIADVQAAHRKLMAMVKQFGESLSDAGRAEGKRLINRMHAIGINVRYLGYVRNACTSEQWRSVALGEMVIRRLKKEFYSILREQLVSKKAPGIAPCQAAAIHFLNLVFGDSAASTKFWQDNLLPSVESYYGSTDDACPHWKVHVFKLVSGSELLLSFCRRSGILLSELAVRAVRDNPQALLVPRPFDSADLEDLGVVVTSLPVASLSQAKLATIKANKTSSRAKAFELNKSAAVLYSTALSISPADPQLLRNLAEVYAALGENSLAEEHFRRAIEVAPGDDATSFKFALYNDHAMHLDEAERLYLEALNQAKKPHRVATFLATYGDFLLTARNNAQAAERSYEAALLVVENHSQALHNLALLREDAELMRRAVSHAENDARRALMNRSLASLLFKQNKLSKAQECYNAFLANEPAPSPPTLYHACDNPKEMDEIREILGPANAFKVRQVALNHPSKVGNASLQEQASNRVRSLSDRLHVPCSCEISYIVCGDEVTLEREFKLRPFLEKFRGQTASIGIIVAYHDLNTGLVLCEETLEGSIVDVTGSEDSWDSCFCIKGFGKTLSQLSEYRAMLNVRRRAYLRMWTQISHIFKF